jgi:hypothetical protein
VALDTSIAPVRTFLNFQMLARPVDRKTDTWRVLPFLNRRQSMTQDACARSQIFARKQRWFGDKNDYELASYSRFSI